MQFFEMVTVCGRCRSRTRTLVRHPVFGTGVCTTQTSPSRISTRDGNRTRFDALRERRPDHWTTRAGCLRLDSNQLSQLRKLGSRPRTEAAVHREQLVRESNPAARCRRPGSDPSTEPSSIRRESNPRIRALHARALPLGHRCTETTASRAATRSRTEPSRLPCERAVPRAPQRRSKTFVERTGIEPAAAALQVQLAPLEHASPETCAVPTRIELAYHGRQPRILTRG